MEKNKDLGICVRCKKNKATIRYTEGTLAYSHGFVENICKKCFDKMQKETPLYKKGFRDGKKEAQKEKSDLIEEIELYIKEKEEFKEKIEELKVYEWSEGYLDKGEFVKLEDVKEILGVENESKTENKKT